MPRKIVLNKQTRKMVHDVHCFMKKEAEEGKIFNLKQVQKRTAAATGTSVATVRRIIKEGNNSEFIRQFRTPGRRRPRARTITNFDNRGVIKRTIHNYYISHRELLTTGKLLKKLQENVNFTGSERSLRRVVGELGFKWKKTDNNRKLLIEKSNIRLLRIEYLQRITKYRNEGRHLIYMDESFIDSTHLLQKHEDKPEPSAKKIKKQVSKQMRLVMVHAASHCGFVPNALLTFPVTSKFGLYHDNANFDNFERWLRSQLIPNIPARSVVVIDHTLYHNKQHDRAPTANVKKTYMKAWLNEKGIEHAEGMSKPQLYELIKAHEDRFKRYYIDKILNENGHDVLRLPPDHPDLSPLVSAWTSIKNYVASKDDNFDIKHVTELVKEKVGQMDTGEWDMLCNRVKVIEEEYRMSDAVLDDMTEEFLVHGEDDLSETDSQSDDHDEDSECDEDVPIINMVTWVSPFQVSPQP